MKALIRILFVGSLFCFLHSQGFAQGSFEYSPDDNLYEIAAKAEAHFTKVGKGRGTGWKQFKRWESMVAPRIYPSDKAFNIKQKVWNETLSYSYSTASDKVSDANVSDWEFLGPSYYTNTSGGSASPGVGRINSVAFHPTDANTFYIAAATGGIWKTTNNGGDWAPLTDGLPQMAIQKIVIDPNDANTLYVLSGDGESSVVYEGSIGVFKSEDGGSTWYSASSGLGWTVTTNIRPFDLVIHPTNSNILLLGTHEGLYRSGNAGTSWTKIKNGLYVYDIEFNTGNPDTIYFVTSSQFFTSSDSGLTFKDSLKRNYIPPGSTVSVRSEIAVTPHDRNTVYWIHALSGTSVFLQRSLDAGKNWTTQYSKTSTGAVPPNILGTWKNDATLSNQNTYDLALAVSPTDQATVFSGGVNIYKSTDSAATFTQNTYWDANDLGTNKYVHADIHELVYNGNNLYACCDGGLFVTGNAGTTWTDLSSGLGIGQIYRLGISSLDRSIALIGTQDNGTFKYSGSSTMNHEQCCDRMQPIFNYSDATMTHIINNQGYIHSSTDEGANWTWISSYPVNSTYGCATAGGSSCTGHWVRPFAVNRKVNTSYYVGYGDVWRWDLSGAPTYTRMMANTVSSKNTQVIAVSNADSNRIYVVNSTTSVGFNSSNLTPGSAPTRDVFMKSDSALTASSSSDWINRTSGLPVDKAKISDVQVDHVDEDLVWVTFSGFAAGEKVYKSTDGGKVWTDFSDGLPNVPVNSIVEAKVGKHDLYVGTDIGVFYRNDDLTKWVPYDNNLPNVIVMDLAVDTVDGYLWAGTYGRGLWRSPINTCSDSLFLATIGQSSSDTTHTYELREASIYIESARQINGQSYGGSTSGTVGTHYRAPSILLKDGFHAKTDCIFYAVTDSCDNVLQSAPRLNGIYAGPLPGATISMPSFDFTNERSESALQVYPNPVTNSAIIQYSINEEQRGSIFICNSVGQIVKEVQSEQTLAAQHLYVHNVDWSDLPAGIYFVNLNTERRKMVERVVLVK